MAKYKLYFSSGVTVLALPFNPEKLPETLDGNNAEYNVLALGPILQPRTPKLRTVSFSGLLPGRRLPGQAGAFRPPAVYMAFFTRVMKKKKPIVYTPVRFYENGTPFLGPSLGFPCLVTSFKAEERGGETGDFYFDLTITEYKDYSPRRAIVQGEGQSSTFAPASGAAETGRTAARTVAAAAAVSAAAALGRAVRVSLTPTRSTPADKLVVGAQRKASGPYYATGDGLDDLGTLHGQTVTVRRIIDRAKPRPVYLVDTSGAALGWMAEADLQEVGG